MKITNKTLLNKIIDHNFKWEDVSNYKTSYVGNVFCFNHPNHDTPAAKLYYNSDDDLWVLYCYAERRGFYVHNYIQKVLCEERQIYKSPLDFLKQHMSEGDIIRQYKALEKDITNILENNLKKKIEYINNVYSETDNVIDYIQRLYCPEDY